MTTPDTPVPAAPMAHTAYAELHCISNFTFLRGASHPEELVEQAHELGYSALALTDECSLAGVVRAHGAAKACGLKLIIGSEFRLEDGLRLVLLVRNRQGYGGLAELITRARRAADKGEYRLSREDLVGLLRLPDPNAGSEPVDNPDSLNITENTGVARQPPACPSPSSLAVVQPCAAQPAGHALTGVPVFQPGRPHPAMAADAATVRTPPETAISVSDAQDLPNLLALWLPGPTPDITQARWLAAAFPGRCWIACAWLADRDRRRLLEGLLYISINVGIPLVATGEVHMHMRQRKPLQDTLTAIRLGTSVQQAGYALFANGERHLRPLPRLARLYPQNLLAESVRIAGLCDFSLDELRYEYPEELVPQDRTPTDYLRQLTEAGMDRRWPTGRPAKVVKLVEHELALIAELQYEPYFLTVYDIVRFAKRQGILCQGRGSAANSAVCYCLGITEVDPARLSTLFERFISKERNEPPDIDVDFEHQRREEVFQYIYRKYGRDRAALAATVITYRSRSAIRDVGKALGLSLEQVDRLTKSLAWWDGRKVLPDRLRETGFDPEHPIIQRLLELVGQIQGFPRHLSQHVGGFVISRGPLCRMVPIENAAMAERTVIQWDKDDLDALGLLKVDCLALGMLTAIHKALDLISARLGKPFRIQDIPAEDPATYAMIHKADTIGVFQIESRAQMSMLPRLKPNCFYDLVIEVAIIRPGPIQGGMVHPFLRRRRGEEPVTYPSEAVRSVLERTLGVPIFQEQVMQLAMVAAGFSAGEADQLRRSMAAWRRKGGLEVFEQRLIEGMKQRGYGEDFARQIFQQILGFGEYGFPESHAASFALLAYVSAWLKRHEPAAFICALLNSLPMGFYAPAQLIQDAQRHGVSVLPVDVLHSDWDCTLEYRQNTTTVPGSPGRKPAASKKLHRHLDNGHPSNPDQHNNHPERTARHSGKPVNKTTLPGDSDWMPADSRDHHRHSDGAHPGNPNLHGSQADQAARHSGEPVNKTELCKTPALRTGLRLVQGLSQAGAQRVMAARRSMPFTSVQDLARRAQLNRHDLQTLARADALLNLGGHRYQSQWQVLAVEDKAAELPHWHIAEPEPFLRTPTQAQNLVTDYNTLGFSLRPHPLSFLRPRLHPGVRSAQQLRQCPHKTYTRTLGLVINRQRPGSAQGVIFMTLEDETGHVNVVIWNNVLERYRSAVLQARLLGVSGVLEKEGEVMNLIAGHLEDLTPLLGQLETRSRDFH